MKLNSVTIHNFRSIIDATASFKGYTLLVGQNNVGKSTVIDAIRAFYEKDGFKFKQECDSPFIGSSDDESWIELEFALSDAEHNTLADEYLNKNMMLRVRKYFKTSVKTQDGKTATGMIFGYLGDGSLSATPFYGAKNVQSGKFGDLVYIPAISKVDEHAKLSGPSALRDLLTDIMSDVVGAGNAYKEFSDSIDKFSNTIREEKTDDDRSLSGLEDEFNKQLKPWNSAFKLKFPPPSAQDIIKSMLGWELHDTSHGRVQGIEYYGSGFQRHFIFTLIQVGSRYISKKSSKKVKDFSPDFTLVLFEEPEAFLHPSQQEILARNLMKLAASGHWQVVCTTHSPHFVSKNAADIPSILILRREANVFTLKQIDDSEWNNIVNANHAIAAIASAYPSLARKMHQDDTKPEMEAIKHFLWLNADRSSLFFANHVLLVEGPTEIAFINRLINDGSIQKADCGLYVLDCIGKFNIHRFMNLLKALGIRHSVIHDDDNNKDHHLDINNLIATTADPTLTFSVTQLPTDLEHYLGIPSAGSDHRKPQHVLYLYDTNQIDAASVKNFCQLIDRCIP